MHLQAYQCFPAEDVAIKTDPVLREVESSLQEDVPLKSTGVVWNRKEKINTTTRVKNDATSQMTSWSLRDKAPKASALLLCVYLDY